MADRKVLIGTPQIDGVGEPAHENWQSAGVDRLVDPNGNLIVAGATGFRIISTIIVQAIGSWSGTRWVQYNLLTGVVTTDGTGHIINAFFDRRVYDPSVTDITGFNWVTALTRASYWMGRTGDDIRGRWGCYVALIGIDSVRVHLVWDGISAPGSPSMNEQGIAHILLP
jgi:hypothetical protein